MTIIPNEGAGKYDAFSELVLRLTRARGVIVMVVDGSSGNGFSISTVDPKLPLHVPKMLRTMADGIEASDEFKIAVNQSFNKPT